MNVPHFYIVQYLPVLDRHRMCPAPMKEIGQKGVAKPCRVPTVECHAQSDLKCTGRIPSSPGRATKGCMVRQRSMRRKPLYLLTQPLDGVMARRGKYGEIRVDMIFPPDEHEYPCSEAGHSFYPASLGPSGVEHVT